MNKNILSQFFSLAESDSNLYIWSKTAAKVNWICEVYLHSTHKICVLCPKIDKYFVIFFFNMKKTLKNQQIQAKEMKGTI